MQTQFDVHKLLTFLASKTLVCEFLKFFENECSDNSTELAEALFGLACGCSSKTSSNLHSNPREFDLRKWNSNLDGQGAVVDAPPCPLGKLAFFVEGTGLIGVILRKFGVCMC